MTFDILSDLYSRNVINDIVFKKKVNKSMSNRISSAKTNNKSSLYPF